VTDIYSKQKRSRIMASISGKETKPEILVRKYLFKQGYRYRKNVTSLPGKPDIVLPRFRTVVLIHGCFWHGHNNCKKATKPSSNIDFWNEKIGKNKQRDKRVAQELKNLGWTVITIWDCQLKNKNLFDNRMRRFVAKLKELERKASVASH
jgi:DNA mismatch endonuclease (patch repair protein)